MVYEGVQFSAERDSKKTLHEIHEPLARVIEILWREENFDDVLIALGAPFMLALSPDKSVLEFARSRYDALLQSLDLISRSAPPAPAKRRGKPAKTHDLRAVVEMLIHRWEMWTCHLPTQDWQARKPTTNAAAFVYDIVEYIDARRLNELPEVMEKAVAKRRKAASAN